MEISKKTKKKVSDRHIYFFFFTPTNSPNPKENSVYINIKQAEKQQLSKMLTNCLLIDL